jgi:ribosomal-protein-serine acetyltransferase
MNSANLKKDLIVSKEIHLSLLSLDDSPVLFDLVQKNRAYLKKWLHWVEMMPSLNEQNVFIKFVIDKFNRAGTLTAAIKYNGKIVGIIGFNSINWVHRSASIGYWLVENKQGKGIVTQSCAKLIEHGFIDLGLQRIEIRCGNNNFSSKRIPEKLGFKLEGVMRSAECLYGEFIDLSLYSLLKTDKN